MLKVCVLGPSDSGKSSMIASIKKSPKSDEKTPSGVSFFRHQVNFDSKCYDV